MSRDDDADQLLDEVAMIVAPLTIALRRDGGRIVAELARADGTIMWPNYADGPPRFWLRWLPNSDSWSRIADSGL